MRAGGQAGREVCHSHAGVHRLKLRVIFGFLKAYKGSSRGKKGRPGKLVCRFQVPSFVGRLCSFF